MDDSNRVKFNSRSKYWTSNSHRNRAEKLITEIEIETFEQMLPSTPFVSSPLLSATQISDTLIIGPLKKVVHVRTHNMAHLEFLKRRI